MPRQFSLAATPAPAGPVLPPQTAALLDTPEAGEFFATGLWYEVLIKHALSPEDVPLFATDPAGTVLLPLLRRKGRLRSLTGPYSLAWRPLAAAGADAAAIAAAGRALAPLLRGGAPVTLELLDPEEPVLRPLLSGLRSGRVLAAAFDHVGNWHERLADGAGWESYLAARPSALRTTIIRKLARSGRTHRFSIADAPGQALEEAIAAYEDVRARSWKPHEPFPHFDAALLRAAAAARVARVGVLWSLASGRADAAQYWILDHARAGQGKSGPRRATVLKLAHDEAARSASPGTVLTALIIRHLIERDGVRVLDFGRGDDAYKRLWADSRRQRIGLVLADPLSPAGAVALVRQWAGPLVRRLRRR